MMAPTNTVMIKITKHVTKSRLTDSRRSFQKIVEDPIVEEIRQN